MRNHNTLSNHLSNIRQVNIYILGFIACFSACGTLFRVDYHILDFGVVSGPQHFVWIPFLLTVFLAMKDKECRPPFTYREKLLLAYTVFTLAALVYTQHLKGTLEAIGEYLTLLVFVFLVLTNVRQERDVKILVTAFLMGSTCTVLIGFYQYFFSHETSSLLKVRGTWSDKNYFGEMLEISISYLVAYMFYSAGTLSKRLVVGFVLFLHGIVSLMTLARATYLGLFISITLFCLIKKRRALPFLIALLVMTAAVLAVIPSRPIVSRIHSVLFLKESLDERVHVIWPGVVSVFKEHNPLWGTGIGANLNPIDDSGNFLIPQSHRRINAHNGILQAILTQGYLGLLFLLVFICELARLSWTNLSRLSTPLYLTLSAGSLIWLTTRTFHSIVGPFFTLWRLDMCIATFVTLTVVSYYSQNEEDRRLGS